MIWILPWISNNSTKKVGSYIQGVVLYIITESFSFWNELQLVMMYLIKECIELFESKQIV